MFSKPKQSYIQRELITLQSLIRIYCQGKHNSEGVLCPDCLALYKYASERMQRCLFLPEKPVCARCPVHCYQPQWRERMREVMRYSGPRLIFSDPAAVFRHLLCSLKKESSEVNSVRNRQKVKANHPQSQKMD